MDALLWTSVFLLLIGLGVYGVWAFRESRVPAEWIRTTFFGGSLAFLALFVAFSWHTMRVMPRATHAEELTPQVMAGKIAWQKYLCVDCHTLLGNGAYYGPDLTKAWNRFVDRSGGNTDAAWTAMVRFLTTPPQASHDRRGMPAVVSRADAESLAEFLRWTSKIETNGWPPDPVRKVPMAQQAPAALGPSPGEAAYIAEGCPACHTIGDGIRLGPDLAGVSSRYDRTTILQWMSDPDAIYRSRRVSVVNSGFPQMPALSLSQEKATLIADYLRSPGGVQ
jgi:nitric oxide reductase subunit C